MPSSKKLYTGTNSPKECESEFESSIVQSEQNKDSCTEEILSTFESEELSILEKTVERGLKAFWSTGLALAQIRDKRLYRQSYKTFEEYCVTRWEMSRRTAYQLIDAAVVCENVRHGTHFLPANERQARTLVSLTPEQQRSAWNKAVSTAPSGKVTAAHVAQVVKEYHQINKQPERLNRNNLAREKEPTNEKREITPSCWDCKHCSHEPLDEPYKFYCNQRGKLSFIEKDGNQLAAECEYWVYRWTNPDETKDIPKLQEEIFTLTLQLSASLRPKLQDAARASGLLMVDWIAKLLEDTVGKKGYTVTPQIHQNDIDVLAEEVPGDKEITV